MNKFHAAKVRRFRGYHNRLFMAFVIPHSWYFVARGELGGSKGHGREMEGTTKGALGYRADSVRIV